MLIWGLVGKLWCIVDHNFGCFWRTRRGRGRVFAWSTVAVGGEEEEEVFGPSTPSSICCVNLVQHVSYGPKPFRRVPLKR